MTRRRQTRRAKIAGSLHAKTMYAVISACGRSIRTQDTYVSARYDAAQRNRMGLGVLREPTMLPWRVVRCTVTYVAPWARPARKARKP